MENGTFVPFIASIRDQMYYTAHRASGCLINDRFIITNAEPFVSTRPATLSIQFNISMTWENTFDTYRADLIIIHPDFNLSTHANDIALIRTDNAVTFHARVQPIKLGEDFVGMQDAIFLGFGFSDLTSNFHAPLIKVDSRTITNEECKQHFDKPEADLIDNAKVCVFPKDDRVACSENYGAALTHDDRLLAIYSWSILWANNTAIVAERISMHLEFIRNNLLTVN